MYKRDIIAYVAIILFTEIFFCIFSLLLCPKDSAHHKCRDFLLFWGSLISITPFMKYSQEKKVALTWGDIRWQGTSQEFLCSHCYKFKQGSDRQSRILSESEHKEDNQNNLFCRNYDFSASSDQDLPWMCLVTPCLTPAPPLAQAWPPTQGF